MTKKTRSIKNQKDYENSDIKDIMEDTEAVKNKALESVPKVKNDEVSRGNETSEEILYGDRENDNINSKKLDSNEKVISSKIRKYAKGFIIPDD
jgi:hypothetical protein